MLQLTNYLIFEYDSYINHFDSSQDHLFDYDVLRPFGFEHICMTFLTCMPLKF